MGDPHVLLWLLVGAIVVGAIALGRWTPVPYLVVLFVVGLGLSFVPNFPVPTLRPDIVFLGFLPALLYHAAYTTSVHDLLAQWRPIALHAVGLVVATLGAVAVVAHTVAGVAWGPAFVLGAVVGPTDPVTATAVVTRLGARRGLTTVLEGEGLVNDGVALVVFRVALAATIAGSFSLGHATARFVYTSLGGVAIGVAVGWVSTLIRRRLDDPPVEIAMSLLIPYVAYLPADVLGLSGVLAAVAAGLLVGWRSHELFDPAGRLQAYAFWDTIVFLLNAVLFVGLGMEFRSLTRNLPGSWAELLVDAAAVSGAVIGARLAWEVLARLPARLVLHHEHVRSWQESAVLGWAGMRGAVSLAAALSIPLTASGSAPFPDRSLVIFLTFAVIVATLGGQGLTLPALVRGLDVGRGASAERMTTARVELARAALGRLEELEGEPWVPEGAVELNRHVYEARLRRLRAVGDGDDEAEDAAEDESRLDRAEIHRRLRGELIAAERAAIVGLQRDGRASAEEVRRLERLLDLDEIRLQGP